METLEEKIKQQTAKGRHIASSFCRKESIMYTSLHSVCTEAIRILNIDSVPEMSILNALARGGVSTIQNLKETEIEQISKFRCIGAVRLGIIIKMKEIIGCSIVFSTIHEATDNVYAYFLCENIFKCHEGIISETKNSRFGIFRSNDHYSTTVITTPGEVYNGVLWLPEENDEEARKLFISHYANRNEALRRQIESNNQKLRILLNV